MSARIVVGIAAALAVSSATHAQIISHRDVGSHMATAMVAAAVAKCEQGGNGLTIAVVDRQGQLRALLVADTAAPHHVELAERKAYTARTFGRTSIEWAQRTETQTQGQRSLSKVIPLQGGVPIKVGEETIGGVGLSGAPNGGPQEEACGKAGIAKVADQLK